MRKRISTLIYLAVAFMVVIIITYMSFIIKLDNYSQESLDTRLNETVQPNVISFNLQIQEQIKKVNTLADYLGSSGTLGDEQHRILINSAVKYNNILRCAIAFPDGSFITNDNRNEGNVSDEDFFIANMRGEFYITEPRSTVVSSDNHVILFAAPIFKDQKVIGSLVYSFPTHLIQDLFNFEFLDNQGSIMIAKSDGTRLIGNSYLVQDTRNLFEYIIQNSNHETEDIITSFMGDSGQYTYDMENSNDTLYVHYEKLEFNDWYMVAMAPSSSVKETLTFVVEGQKKLSYVIVFCAVAYLIVLAFIWIKAHKNIDAMTGALTVEGFKRKAKKMIQEHVMEQYVCVKMDVKDFKLINRLYDFKVGDLVIKNIALALGAIVTPDVGIFARVSTDVYVILLKYENREKLAYQREAFIGKFREIMGNAFTTSVIFPTGQYILSQEDILKPDIVEILEKVNFAHRAAKQNYDIIVDYAENIEKKAMIEKEIVDKMSDGIINEEFTLYLQPKYFVSNEELCGAEALVRWVVDDKVFKTPDEFIPILERNGFITKLDKYMFEATVKKIRSFLDAGLKPIIISVNFSRLHLANENFVNELCEITDRYNVPREYLEIELTESIIFDDVEIIIDIIDQLHKEGFKMAMDDFGSGYSCLAQLKDLQVDVLKIDKGFFDVGADTIRAKTVVESIISMSKRLGIITVAEGIETKEQVETLRELGCDVIQGFYFGKPMNAKEFTLDLIPDYRK